MLKEGKGGVRSWAKALLAVLLGNLAYFAVMPKLLPLLGMCPSGWI